MLKSTEQFNSQQKHIYTHMMFKVTYLWYALHNSVLDNSINPGQCVVVLSLSKNRPRTKLISEKNDQIPKFH